MKQEHTPSRRLPHHLFACTVTTVMTTIAVGCGSDPEAAEHVGRVTQAQGIYHLRAEVDGSILDESRGWEVEISVPELTSAATSTGVLGQWYWNLESGIYHTGDGWFVYYFGDDNGIEDRNPLCDNLWDPVGGFCRGPFEDLQPGQQIVFRYEYCTEDHEPDVAGTQLCLSVNLNDGQGFRFITADSRTTVEMYTHTETFSTSDPMVIPCSGASKMVGQRRKTPSGAWVDMSGASTWTFHPGDGAFQFTNQDLSSSPSSWEICSTPPPAEPCSPAEDMPDYYSGAFDTTGSVCKRTANDIVGWGCSNFEGRTLEVNNVPVNCGDPLPPKFDGYYYFDVSAGSYPWAALYWWY